MAMIHAVMPKDDWLADLGLAHRWPIFGLPELLHADNAAEFLSSAVARGARASKTCLRPRSGRHRCGGCGIRGSYGKSLQSSLSRLSAKSSAFAIKVAISAIFGIWDRPGRRRGRPFWICQTLC
jgi:hypothetical protein